LEENEMTNAVGAIGTLLQIGNGASPEVFTTVAEITDIGGPKQGIEFIEVTHHGSLSGYREYVPSFKDGGSVSLSLNFLGDELTQGFTTSGLRHDFDDRNLRNYQIKFTNHDKASFAAYVEHFEPKAGIGAALTATASLKITGPVTWATWS
jgi:hypothetical protein